MTTQGSGSGTGAGFQTPFDSNSPFTVTCFIVQQLLAELDVMRPVQVTAVHPGAGGPPGAAGTVDVQLLVSSIDGSGNTTPAGKVSGLPYFRVQAGAWAIVADPVVGDYGFLIAASQDISHLVAALTAGRSVQAGSVTPGSWRRMSVADGIYVGGCLNKAPTQYLWLKPDGTAVLKDGKGNTITTSAGGVNITDCNTPANQIQMTAGQINLVTTVFKVNGVAVTVP
jgi:hypothetical protein